MTLELVRLCRTCGERPSGRYFNCKRCRENDYKKPCPEEGCSNLKSRNSKRCAECRGKLRGPDHPAWRGGRIEGGDGYIRVYVPDHPKANMGRYITEHMHVMEQALGRHLRSTTRTAIEGTTGWRTWSYGYPVNLLASGLPTFWPGLTKSSSSTDTRSCLQHDRGSAPG